MSPISPRKQPTDAQIDRNSLIMIWVVIGVSMLLGAGIGVGGMYLISKPGHPLTQNEAEGQNHSLDGNYALEWITVETDSAAIFNKFPDVYGSMGLTSKGVYFKVCIGSSESEIGRYAMTPPTITFTPEIRKTLLPEVPLPKGEPYTQRLLVDGDRIFLLGYYADQWALMAFTADTTVLNRQDKYIPENSQ